MAKLPDKQQKILDFIKTQHLDTGVFPSVREIAAHMDFKSTNTVDYHLRRMEANGVLERGGRRARSFAGFTNPGSSGEGRNMAIPGRIGTKIQQGRGIPLLGRVAAGEPILAEQHIEDVLNVGTMFPCDDQTFALRVQGDSMIEAGIMNGDMVIVKQQSDISNGEIGVALVDGEATVKRIYDDRKIWRLEPENRELKAIIVTKGVEEFSIAGKVIGVIRQM